MKLKPCFNFGQSNCHNSITTCTKNGYDKLAMQQWNGWWDWTTRKPFANVTPAVDTNNVKFHFTATHTGFLFQLSSKQRLWLWRNVGQQSPTNMCSVEHQWHLFETFSWNSWDSCCPLATLETFMKHVDVPWNTWNSWNYWKAWNDFKMHVNAHVLHELARLLSAQEFQVLLKLLKLMKLLLSVDKPWNALEMWTLDAKCNWRRHNLPHLADMFCLQHNTVSSGLPNELKNWVLWFVFSNNAKKVQNWNQPKRTTPERWEKPNVVKTCQCSVVVLPLDCQ